MLSLPLSGSEGGKTVASKPDALDVTPLRAPGANGHVPAFEATA